MLRNLTENPFSFFNILPEDWQESLLPQWSFINKTSWVYVLEQNHEICAGGIVFSEVIPEMEEYIKEAEMWFLEDYHYIGYIWVPSNKRNSSYGSQWLKELLDLNKSQKYWLTIEDKSLRYFYEKNGFRYIKTLYLDNAEEEEELFIFDNFKNSLA